MTDTWYEVRFGYINKNNEHVVSGNSISFNFIPVNTKAEYDELQKRVKEESSGFFYWDGRMVTQLEKWDGWT
jgi:hypothetical protein